MTDSRGRPVSNYLVIVFAEDSARWRLPMSRFIRVASPDQQGRFKVTALPPEEYLVVATLSNGEGEWNDPEYLERLQQDP